jgi:microcystin-dependent protein
VSVSVVDSTGRAKSSQLATASLIDVLSALPSAASVPQGTRAFALDLGIELVAYGGTWRGIAGALPLGAQLSYAGSVDPGDIGGGITFLLADGRLISRTVYAAFFTAVGHKYNGGVDPGSSQVRLPDKRGRASVGADNMGTAQGAASRIPNSNRAAGQNGGEERHTPTVAELAAHGHVASYSAFAGRAYSGNSGLGETTAYLTGANGFTGLGAGSAISIGSQGSGTPHNVMQPYEVDNVIVRVA